MHPYKGHVYVILLVYLIISLESSIEKFFIISAWNLYNYYCLNIVVSFEKKDAHLLYARRCRLYSRVRVLIIACMIDIIYIYIYIHLQTTNGNFYGIGTRYCLCTGRNDREDDVLRLSRLTLYFTKYICSYNILLHTCAQSVLLFRPASSSLLIIFVLLIIIIRERFSVQRQRTNMATVLYRMQKGAVM